MDKVPDNIVNKTLYLKAIEIANNTYKRHSAYKSMFIQTTYKKLGGKYYGKKKIDGVERWNKEEWIQVLPYLLENKKVACGSGSNKKGCRPYKRVDKNTPKTIKELIKIHGRDKLIKLAKLKQKNMDIRINWEKGVKY